MAHFAKLNEQNEVTTVVVISNDDLIDANGVEQEHLGISVCKKIFGENTRWVQCSFNSRIRRTFPAIGFIYEPTVDAFYSPNPPFASWSLNANFEWEAPIPKPADRDGLTWIWDENQGMWQITAPMYLPEG